MTESTYEKTRKGARSFFMGKAYPALVCLTVLLGSVFSIELFSALLISLSFFFSMLVCDSARPAIVIAISFVLQISVKNAPKYPTFSSYLYTGWRLYLVILIAVIIISGILALFIRRKLYREITFKKTPLLLPLLLFCTAMMLGGMFTDGYTVKSMLVGLMHSAAYTVIFLFFYHGLSDSEENADSENIGEYLSYVALLVSAVIMSELAILFMTSDNIIINGSINKVGVALGWGIWNLVGSSLSVLIPLISYGIQRSRYPIVYFLGATFTWLFAVLTMSRNALVFATLAYAASMLIFCFVGKYKRAFRITVVLGILIILAFAFIMRDRIADLLKDYLDRGMSDNGRFALWRQAFDSFLESPLHGKGFCGFNVETAVFGPLPKMAHNTVLQLLSSTGILGLLAYGYYRYRAVKPFFVRPSLEKTMLGLSVAVLLFSSLIDNFVFNVYPTFLYSIILATVHRESLDK